MTEMRTSTYEVFLPLINRKEEEIAGRTLLGNGLYGAMDILPKEYADKVKTGDFESLPPALRERLLLRGHITCKDKDAELADQKLLGRIYRTVFARRCIDPYIMPTYDCNFRCTYCFEQHRLCRGQEWLDHTMSPQMIENIFKALKGYKDRGYMIKKCSLFGGEPFLSKNIETVRSICRHCQELGLEIDAVTNGYELETFIDLLEEFKIKSLHITVDGIGSVNDRMRLHKSGCGTYEKILKNIELALQHDIKISMRVNVTRYNLHRIKELIDDITARGLTENKNYSYYFRAIIDHNHPENSIQEHELTDELMSIGFTAQEAMEHQNEYSGLAYMLQKLMKKEKYPDFSPCYCGAERGMTVIDPFGHVYPCTETVAKEEAVTGYVDQETGRIIWNFDKAKWCTRTSDLMASCQGCPYAFICQGGCASKAITHHGSFSREYCGEYKEIIQFIVSRTAGAVWEENHAEELTLSLAGPVSRLTEADRKTIMETRNQEEMLKIIEKAGFILK